MAGKKSTGARGRQTARSEDTSGSASTRPGLASGFMGPGTSLPSPGVEVKITIIDMAKKGAAQRKAQAAPSKQSASKKAATTSRRQGGSKATASKSRVANKATSKLRVPSKVGLSRRRYYKSPAAINRPSKSRPVKRSVGKEKKQTAVKRRRAPSAGAAKRSKKAVPASGKRTKA